MRRSMAQEEAPLSISFAWAAMVPGISSVKFGVTKYF